MSTAPIRTQGRQTPSTVMWLGILFCLATPVFSVMASEAREDELKASAQFVFSGNREIDEATLREAAENELEDFKSHRGRESDLDDAAYQMEAVYRVSGFPFAEVDYRFDKSRTELSATFSIREGPRVFLKDIRFEGNTVFKADELIPLFEKNQNKALKSGRLVFVESEVQDAVVQIRDVYRGSGYLDVSIRKPAILFSDEDTRATVVVSIEENRQYVLRSINYEGDVIAPARDQLSRLQRELAGQPFFPRREFSLKSRILEIYGNLGHADAAVEISRTTGEQENDVILTAAVTSGPRITIESVEVHGNVRTRDRFIRSRLQLKPGDPFSIEKKQSSFRRLYRTGLFSAVDITLKDTPSAERRILVVTVSEAPAKEVYVEPGWGSYERLRFKFGFREANLLGTGRIFEASSKLSVKAQGVVFSLVDPWFLNTDITAELPVSFERREEPSFTREDLSASFLLTKELSEQVTTTGGYTFKRTTITYIDITEFDPNQDEDYNLASLKAQIGYDTRNDIFFPTKGQKSFLSVEHADDALGGEITFTRLAGGLRYFFRLRQSTVLAMRCGTGIIIPGPDEIGVPISERFFNGGENSVRSFEEAQLGPKDSSNDPTGGLAFNVISVELRQQLVNRFIATLFVDLGNVAPNRSRQELGKPPYDSRSEIWQDTLDDYFSDFRPAVGVGLQYLLPFGPARLDLAVNPDRDKERDENLYAWHFSIGMAF